MEVRIVKRQSKCMGIDKLMPEATYKKFLSVRTPTFMPL